MGKLTYKPWLGKEYGKRGYRGHKLLILGESHHQDYRKDAALRWTQAHIESPFPFWSTIEQIVVGRRLVNERARRLFWESVAYTNVVQATMHTSQDRPTESHLRRARLWFSEIVQEVDPEVVFLFSTLLWDRLPDDREFPDSRDIDGLESPHPRAKPAYHYATPRGGGFVAGCFYHPSYLRRAGLPLRPWHEWAKRLLQYVEKTR